MKRLITILSVVLLLAYGVVADTVTFSFGAAAYTLEIAEEYVGNYVRDEWGSWRSLPDTCLDVRGKVLAEESLVPVKVDTSGSDCSVVEGYWICPYTGKEHTNPSDLDIDHMVPLKEAYDSGAHRWDREKRRAYYNDLSHANHLIAVDDYENQTAKNRRDLRQNTCLHVQLLGARSNSGTFGCVRLTDVVELHT